MKTILLPVDFSAASHHAARYAAELSASPEFRIGRIVLLNSYFVSLYEQILPTPDFVQVGSREITEKRGVIREKLRSIREEILPFVGGSVTVETMESDEPLLRSILGAIGAQNPDLLVVGAGGDSEIADQIIGIARIPALGARCPLPRSILRAGNLFERDRS